MTARGVHTYPRIADLFAVTVSMLLVVCKVASITRPVMQGVAAPLELRGRERRGTVFSLSYFPKHPIATDLLPIVSSKYTGGAKSDKKKGRAACILTQISCIQKFATDSLLTIICRKYADS